jgi:outer membrane receptor protein involved in Fe transport
LNQPFGDVVSWDLIPRIAIASSTLMPGSNPLFGLNTLGGALSLRSKSGDTNPGTSVTASYGSDVRRMLELEHGGSRGARVNWYLAGSFFGDDGWRDASPSDVRQLFGKLGWTSGSATQWSLTAAHADNQLRGNGLQEQRLLDARYDSVYTTPDITDDRSLLVNLGLTRVIGARAFMTAAVHYRALRTQTLNGDVDEDALRARDPGFTALVNRTRTRQRSAGASAQVTKQAGWLASRITAGGAFDRSRAAFAQSTELGYLDTARGARGAGVFDEDVSVDLDGLVRTWSVYATSTMTPAPAWRVTGSARYNRTAVHNRDEITPGGGAASLDGDHVFARVNPAAGVTFNATPRVNVYAGYTEGSRAATSIELGCANPEQPCRLPNALAGDPPLRQVVTRTVDAGVRGQRGSLSWNAGVFHAVNRDDIQFVTSERTGFGYFTNVDRTRRQGVEAAVRGRLRRADLGASYTRLDATFESEERLNGSGNSSNDTARNAMPGLEGSIEVHPGDRIPLVPRHMLKLSADVQATRALALDVDLQALSGSWARGNENNLHEPDGLFYLGPGATRPYSVVNAGARYAVRPWVHLIAQASNVFDRQYHTAAQLGPVAFTPAGVFMPQPFGTVNGVVPVTQSTFYAPGAPRRAWVGLRFRFKP